MSKSGHQDKHQDTEQPLWLTESEHNSRTLPCNFLSCLSTDRSYNLLNNIELFTFVCLTDHRMYVHRMISCPSVISGNYITCFARFTVIRDVLRFQLKVLCVFRFIIAPSTKNPFRKFLERSLLNFC